MHANPPSLLGDEPGLTQASRGVRRGRDGLRRMFVGAALLGPSLAQTAFICLGASGGLPGLALAYTATLNPASPKTVYLQVGAGSFSNPPYISGGQPANNTTVNTVSATVAPGVVGNGTAQGMTSNSTAAQSYWDNYAYCNVPGQVYIGGFYRTTGGTSAAALVTATVPAALVDAGGDAIAFSKIRWTSSGNGDNGAEPFPSGTFVSGGVQNVGSMGANTWNESCWTFTYANNSIPAAGTFTGRVLYTLSSP